MGGGGNLELFGTKQPQIPSNPNYMSLSRITDPNELEPLTEKFDNIEPVCYVAESYYLISNLVMHFYNLLVFFDTSFGHHSL